MGADEEGSNYYYNWVTGESSYEKPEGWYPPAEEVWLRRPFEIIRFVSISR